MAAAAGYGKGETITSLLRGWQNGDQESQEKVIRIVYDELRKIAGNFLRNERHNTLQPTELVNEAFIRLVDQKNIEWEDRHHFMGIAAHLMRQILIEYLRKKKALKRGGANRNLLLDEVQEPEDKKPLDLIKLDEALKELEGIDPDKCRIVELRFFTGLTLSETARVMKISHAKVKREWTMAKAWLFRYISGDKK